MIGPITATKRELTQWGKLLDEAMVTNPLTIGQCIVLFNTVDAANARIAEIERERDVAKEALRILANDGFPTIEGECAAQCYGYRDLLGRCVGVCSDGVSAAYAVAEADAKEKATAAVDDLERKEEPCQE